MTNNATIITSALPYANGHLHLGHMVEHVLTDIWVRAHRMLKKECISICADDAHGTPIMLRAEKEGVTPETLIATFYQSHVDDLVAFDIHYDAYHSTHSEENRQLAEKIYQACVQHNFIITKDIAQLFDPIKEMFLPDRYVKGTCPKCNASDQYGDNCEACGATYSPADLINPVSALSGATPIEKTTTHYFFDLPKHIDFLKTYTKSGVLPDEMANKLNEWFKDGLKQWDITRDAPYFGFLIPGTTDKYFYVWLDAPIGYMSSFATYCKQNNLDFNAFWHETANTNIYHVIGKDIMYFHALFWPALLKTAQYKCPTKIVTHGFLTINGQKMSKSRGTFIEARQYRQYLPTTALRYYFATKLSGSIEDIDLNRDDFIQRVNSDLIGKLINIASRSAGFIHKLFDDTLSDTLIPCEAYVALCNAKDDIIQAYLDLKFNKAIQLIMARADDINQWVDTKKPWALAKHDETRDEVQGICTVLLNAYRVLIGYLKPIIPALASASEAFLHCPPIDFDTILTPLLSHKIGLFTPLMSRLDDATVDLVFPKKDPL